jgi:hypothetical protein
MTISFASDTPALMQKGVYQQPGFYGNQELSDSNDSFNTAVGIASALIGFAGSLKQKQAPPNYARTKDNYILTTLEKQAIHNKASQLAAYGVVPYDTLENFLYVLAATESPNDMLYISNVVGIPQLNQPYYVRNIRAVCDIQDIYKIGYLSQGLASVNQRYSSNYSNMETYADVNQSSFGPTNTALNLSQQLGVIGPLILSSAMSFNGGHTGSLASSPLLSAVAITQSVNSYATLSAVPYGTLPPSTIGAILNPAATYANQAATVGSSVISSLLSASPLGGALGALGPLGGIAMGMLLGQSGGNSIGSFMSQILTGNRISCSRIANNPMLTPPSYAGKAFFGEAPISHPAVDQLFCRRVGAFGSMSGGNGVTSFGMQNFASMGTGMAVSSLVSYFTTGSFEPPAIGTFFGDSVDQHITAVASILNVQHTATIEPRRSDNAIPFMIGMSSAIAGETFSPFGSSHFSNGWKLAASTANDIQKYNPQYLQTCQSSL